MTHEKDKDVPPTIRIPTQWPFITFLTFVIGATIIYSDMRSSARIIESKVNALEDRTESLASRQAKQETDVAVIRTTTENILSLIKELRSDIKDARSERVK